MAVRLAVMEDLDAIVALAHEMHQESPTYSKLEFNDEKFLDHLGRLHRVFVAEVNGTVVGMMGCYAQQTSFSLELIAFESGLFITKEHRGGRLALALIKAYEEWAMSQGVARINLGTSTGIEADRVKALYERLGYTHVGYSFIKDRS